MLKFYQAERLNAKRGNTNTSINSYKEHMKLPTEVTAANVPMAERLRQTMYVLNMPKGGTMPSVMRLQNRSATKMSQVLNQTNTSFDTHVTTITKKTGRSRVFLGKTHDLNRVDGNRNTSGLTRISQGAQCSSLSINSIANSQDSNPSLSQSKRLTGISNKLKKHRNKDLSVEPDASLLAPQHRLVVPNLVRSVER